MRFSLCFAVLRAAIVSISIVLWNGLAFAEEARPLPPQPAADSPMNAISVETSKGKHSWIIDLASDDESRGRGLMFVSSMPQNRGMLFKFEAQRPVHMWMKNTYISLDMIFMTESGLIASLHKGAVPHSQTIISSGSPARYVLELNAGEIERAGLTVGQTMRHPWFRPGS